MPLDEQSIMKRLSIGLEESRIPGYLDALEADADGAFFWDLVAFEDLRNAIALVWNQPYPLSSRSHFADFYAMRTMRRVVALDELFQLGLYAECVPLVRAAYEDWIATAYTLLPDGDERARGHAEDLKIHDAKVRRTFRDLAGNDATDRTFESSDDFDDWESRQVVLRRPWAGASWKQMASESSLTLVHQFVYSHLSGLSHGCLKNTTFVFEHDDQREMMVAQIPGRDRSQEELWAIWAYWFSLRTITICAREHSVDLEAITDHALLVLRQEDSVNFASAACVRETRCTGDRRSSK